MRVLLSIFILSVSLNSFAKNDCTLALASQSPLLFRNVEVFRRNNNIGLQQVGDIRFKEWFEVGPFVDGVSNFIGLTDEGSIYHLVQWQNRRVARLLSGEKKFQSIHFQNNSELKARDESGQLLTYSAIKWLTSPVKSIVKEGLTITAIGSATAVATLAYFFPDVMAMGFDTAFFKIPIMPVFLSGSIAFQTFFVMLFRYERLNTFPDGFTDHAADENTANHWIAPDVESLPPPMPEAAIEDQRKP